ncbi:glutamate receptor ionotropic, kainate 3-like isoform X1 [Trichoplusia ni]|uniref:Glutamate receptor ionotropic, kainate 3-like isoform X1 n=2 Tax=Trichoplusia ni TaxID=7111 RepID=A0A7E5W0B3_TRINI|nr:glutamate receptor ionotropic, kainate 3-like isoform X1 [Trichoplusia ni]
MFVVWFVLVLSSQCVLSQEAEGPTLGGIFYEDSPDMKVALEVAAKLFNFKTSVKEISKRGEVLEVSQYVCELAEEGVIGIIDGTGGRAMENIQALCDMLELPHVIVSEHNDLYNRNWSALNMYPSPSVYNQVLQNLVILKDWRAFTILYLRGYSLLHVSDLLQMGNKTYPYIATIRELSGNDYREVLIDAKHNGYTNFVVDCPSRNLEEVLLHAQQVGMMADEHSYIFISPDLFTLDMSRFRYGGVNMTGFRLVKLEDVENIRLWNFTYLFNQETGKALEAEELKTILLLIYDAVEVFAAAIKKVNVEAQQLSCANYDAWIYGSSLMNFMKTNKVEGLTRTLIFDGVGQRTDVTFDVLEITSAGNQTIGTWKKSELILDRPLVADAEITQESALRNKTLKVLISTTAPYGYLKDSHEKLEGNDRYEGFTIDLIDRLSDLLGFSYEFAVENNYGSKKEGKWNGMALQLMEDKADLAICDLTMTAERQSGIDFSTPFMTLGIGILYKEPSKQPPEMFSFMAVFSKEVWYYMMLIQLALGGTMIFVGRISHKEWQNPVPCIESPEELSNQFSFANSVWLIIGSVMQQGSEIAPIALAPRMITSVWWFFTMVMVASYVGTLVAFLTVEKNILPFNTVEELYNHKSISYGAKEQGSTIKFFQDSENPIYQEMYKKMVARNWLVKDNDIGVQRAENQQYAFFMESTSIEYYKERHCDLLQIGMLLDSKSYGIGMKKKSPYKRYIDDALLKLKESGEIDKLKNIWWKEKRGGGKCGEKRDEEQKQLGMKNMLGAFVVLGVGCLIGLFISIIDMLWGVFKRSVKYSTTFKYELVEELKFALKFSGNIKPVKRPQKANIDSSFESLAKAEGKDEIRSLHSIRSGKSIDTHRTHHSHSSRHSSRSLSVAFAKRRSYS